jgi:putative tryptophan/tyrosine transport system substrate-binding protein
LKIPQRSSLLPYRGVLSFRPEARGALAVKRREFIALIGGAAGWPLVARAQTPPLVGYLTVSSKAIGEKVAAAFRGGLSEAGFAEGRNVIVEYRYADGQIDRLRSFAEDFVRRGANVIAAMGGSRAALVAQSATTTTPIVFTMGDADPVHVGVVASLARPGGNATGISLLGGLLGAKRVELLRALVPFASTIGF